MPMALIFCKKITNATNIHYCYKYLPVLQTLSRMVPIMIRPPPPVHGTHTLRGMIPQIKEIRHHLKQFERHVAPARALCDRLAAAVPLLSPPFPFLSAHGGDLAPSLWSHRAHWSAVEGNRGCLSASPTGFC